MLRVTVLSLLILISAAVMLPWEETTAQGENRAAASQSQRRQVRRHTRAWMRRRRALLRRRRAIAAMRRQRAAALARARRASNAQHTQHASMETRRIESVSAAPAAAPAALVSASRMLQDPHGQWHATLPRAWINAESAAGEARFNLRAPDGSPAGIAVFAPVIPLALPVNNAPPPTRRSGMNRMMGNTPHAALRQLVIERMIGAGGWVVNDLERTMGGRRVFAVVAQTGERGIARETWVFYFTVVDGRLYSLATVAPLHSAAFVAAGSEQVLASLRETAGRTLVNRGQRSEGRGQ